MGIMWLRILTGKGQPAAATAATVVQTLPVEEKKSQTVVTYVAPPFVEGRNDTLTTDCFHAR